LRQHFCVVGPGKFQHKVAKAHGSLQAIGPNQTLIRHHFPLK
jgi:hypothetical protein